MSNAGKAQPKQKFLFICHHNSGRSQLSEAMLRHLYGDRFEAYSAGVVASSVNPYAVKVMEQIGVDMSRHRSKSIEEYADVTFDYVVTVCDQARESCPFFPGRQVLHRNIPSALSSGSEEEVLASWVRVRDEIKVWIEGQFGG